ncbi:MAG: hypothetical protein ACHQTF_09730 [Gemmatimonadales bacterium]
MAAASLAVSLAACAHHGEVASLDIVRDSTLLASGSSVLGSAPITVGDFEFKATNGGLKSRWAPMIVQVTVTVTNVSQHAAALNVLGGNCEVLIRVYAHHIPPKAPAYDASGPGVSCYVPVSHFGMTPGQSVTLQSASGGPGVYLAPGRYDLAAIVSVSDSSGTQRVQIPAGSVRMPPPYE